MTKLLVTFRNFEKAPKIENCVLNGEEGQKNRMHLPLKILGRADEGNFFLMQNFVINQISITQAHIFKST
jgi:hypothetical protein